MINTDLMELIEQGKAGILNAPCGTNGLGTCVGLAVSIPPGFQRWFIAHIDCASQVRSGSGPCFDAVREETERTAQALHPATAGSTVYIVSAGRDFSTRAIVQGLQAVYGNIGVEPRDGFYVDAQGQLFGLHHEENNTPGTAPFSIPKLPAC